MKWAESCDYTIPEHPDQANREHIQHAPHAKQIYLALCLSVQDGSEAMVIELLEKEVREYEQRYNKTFDVHVKTATLVHLAPEPVQKHVYLNEGSYRGYATTRRLIMDFVEQH
eukprot:5221572-Amphidinium_carterae.1